MIQIDDFINYGIKYLIEYTEKLADEFQHFFGLSVSDKNNNFPVLTYFTDIEGKWFKNIGPDMPKKIMSSLYSSTSPFENEIKAEYFELAKKYGKPVTPEVYSAIFQSPFKIASFKIDGDERLIKKLSLSEKLKGNSFISLNEKISEDTFSFIVEHFKISKNGIYYYPYLSDIHIVFELDKKFNSENRTLAVEIGRILKEKIKLSYPHIESSYKIPEMNIKKPILSVIKIPADKILEYDFNQIYQKICYNIDKSIKDINSLTI